MDKPKKVEIRQWWMTPYLFAPIRVEAVDAQPTTSRYSARLTSEECAILLRRDDCKYLGCGENPEPSEEMLNMLAEHAAEIDGIPLAGCPPEMRQERRGAARYAVTGGTNTTLPYLTRAMLSLYKILRKLGKW
jgi:hypothetical protein